MTEPSFDLTSARFLSTDDGWPLDLLPEPGEDPTGTVLVAVPGDLADELVRAAHAAGTSVAAEAARRLRTAARPA